MDKSGICDGQGQRAAPELTAPANQHVPAPTSAPASPVKHPIVRVHHVHKLER